MKLENVQVEVSTHCQLSCLMCPKRIFRREWISGHMDMEIFRRIPFEKFRYAHLQGWGEPLLNPNIIEMVEFAKAKGCRVGITTNGLLLDEFAEDLVKAGIDLVAISIASADEKTHRKIRGCKLSDLLENIRMLSNIRGKPKITLVTMMLKDTINDLPKFVEMAKDVGADEVIANNLDYIPSPDLTGLEVFSEKENREVLNVIRKAEELAKRLGISFFAKPIKLEEALVCAEDPISSCLITVDGHVSPCVYAHLPTRSDEIIRVFRGKVVRVRKRYFGSLVEEDFEKVWKCKEYKDFRARFERRKRAIDEFLVLELPELPDVCKTCYKAYSV